MKTIIKIILMVTTLTTFTLCKAKTVYIDSVYIYSEHHSNDSSNLYLVFSGHFTTVPCNLKDASVLNYDENELTFRACYGVGPVTTLCYRTDTFFLGTLPNQAINIQAIFNAAGG